MIIWKGQVFDTYRHTFWNVMKMCQIDFISKKVQEGKSEEKTVKKNELAHRLENAFIFLFGA